MAKNKVKFNNEYKIPNEKADEIWRLSNKELINRIALEYKNWTATEAQKKDDPKIAALKNQIKELMDAMKEDPAYLEAEEQFQNRKDELESEELSRYREELKNESGPYREDVALYKGLFQLSMDELDKRKSSGLLKLDGI